jgi:cytochrome b
MQANRHTTITVWDPLIRIFHWLLASSFVVAYVIEDERLNLHLLAGSMIAGLLLFRLSWGFIGTPFSRFRDFLYSVAEIRTHLSGLLRLSASSHPGHTPAGSAMIFVLLASLALLSISGIALYGIEQGHGPLGFLTQATGLETMYFFKSTHRLLADIIALLIALHIGGVLLESILQKQNLTLAMITGRKNIQQPTKEVI